MNIEPKVRQAHAPRAKRIRPTEETRAEEVCFFPKHFDCAVLVSKKIRQYQE